MARWAVVVFARPIRPESVKTRLAPVLGPETTAALYSCFLSDTVSEMFRLQEYRPPIEVLLAWESPPAESENPLPEASAVSGFLQVQGNLGARIQAAFAEVFQRGFARAAIIGSDMPLLEAQRVYEGLSALEECDLALGPCLDGGYYLIAAGALYPALFEGIEWGTEKVLQQTLHAAQQEGLRFHLLAPGYDVDSLEDLRRLEEDLSSAGGKQIPCPRTFEFLCRRKPLRSGAKDIENCRNNSGIE